MEQWPQPKHPDPIRQAHWDMRHHCVHTLRAMLASGRDPVGGGRSPRGCRPYEGPVTATAKVGDSLCQVRPRRDTGCSIASRHGTMRRIRDRETLVRCDWTSTAPPSPRSSGRFPPQPMNSAAPPRDVDTLAHADGRPGLSRPMHHRLPNGANKPCTAKRDDDETPSAVNRPAIAKVAWVAFAKADEFGLAATGCRHRGPHQLPSTSVPPDLSSSLKQGQQAVYCETRHR